MKTQRQQLRKYAQCRKLAKQAVEDARANPRTWFGLSDYLPDAQDDLDEVVYGDGFTVGFNGDYCDYDEEETVVDVLATAWLPELSRLTAHKLDW